MNIAALNEIITIEKCEPILDEIGNHMLGWKPYQKCHVTVSGANNGGQSGATLNTAGQVVDVSDIAFTLRFCERLSHIDNLSYRVVFRGETYDILTVDHMNYKRKCIKLRCKKVRR